jgi:hypothetical protein
LMFDAYSNKSRRQLRHVDLRKNGTKKSTAPHALIHAVVVSQASAKV